MKKILAFILGVTATTTFAANYKVTVPLSEDFEGAMAYLINFDSSQKIDSVLVQENVAEFNGQIDEPVMARLIVDGNRMAQFILEEGDITVNPKARTVSGGTLNEANNRLEKKMESFSLRFRDAKSKEEQNTIYNEYIAYSDSVLNANLTNPIGYAMFMDKGYEMSAAELEAFVAANPYFAKFERVQKLLEANRRKAATSEGSKFADFEIEYEGVKHKLSDVVGKGDFVLVDFWASWCGPCIRQTAVLKDIYNQYKDDGLKVLGVAVWDEPENTKKAIVQHALPWESWLNGQNIPTDVYGISGIPCIILFGPDGTILSRDKQDDDLRRAVANAMNEAKASK